MVVLKVCFFVVVVVVFWGGGGLHALHFTNDSCRLYFFLKDFKIYDPVHVLSCALSPVNSFTSLHMTGPVILCPVSCKSIHFTAMHRTFSMTGN